MVNLTDEFNLRSRHAPIIINEFKDHSKKGREAFDNKLFTRYQPNDVLSNIPSCEGGHLTGEFHKGMTCPECNTVVENPMDQDLQSKVWLKAPNRIPKLINPMAWTMLSSHFKKGKFNVIQYLCDTTYQAPAKPPKVLAQINALGVKRGYKNFVENFDIIIERLMTIRDFRKKKRSPKNPMVPLEDIQRIIIENRDCIFVDYLPLPNRALLVIEDTSLSTYRDPMVDGAINAIKSMIGLDDPLMNLSQAARENRVVRAMAQLAQYYQDFYRGSFSKKEGILRKHVYGTRCFFSFRSVISSLTADHHHEELHIPWGIGIGLMRVHLTAELYRRNFTPNQVVRLLNNYAQKYHPLLDELFKKFISDSPYMGLPCIFQRNPSLERGSMQRVFITKVKTDVSDPTVSMSILTVRGYNADFDGKLNCLRINFSNCWKLLLD